MVRPAYVLASQVGLELTTHPVRNIVVPLACSASCHSLFLSAIISLLLALRAVDYCAVNSRHGCTQAVGTILIQKQKRVRKIGLFYWLPKLDSNQRPCG